jgi:M6 family metalloprotease-like protein
MEREPDTSSSWISPILSVAGVALACLLAAAAPAGSQLWLEFAHPDDPHVFIGGGTTADVPLSVPDLLQGPGDATVYRPVLVVLMDWSDMTHRSVHAEEFWQDLIFGDPRDGVRPSLYTMYDEMSNGRLQLVPAVGGDVYDGLSNGIVGWIASDSSSTELTDTNRKRAEAIRVADPYFDYHVYDVDEDGVVTTDELLVIAVFADNAARGASCEQHLGHPDPPACEHRPGGNTRPTDPVRVPVDAGGNSVEVHQWIAGVGEMAHVGVVAHEIAHSTFGHADLYSINPTACTTYQQTATGYTCDGNWYPPPPGFYSIMDAYFVNFIPFMESWGMIHLGFTLPKVITHDGTYTLYDTETKRPFSTQSSQPEALIIYDPMSLMPYYNYFILENRNLADMPDQGLAVWLIGEYNAATEDKRKVVRLIRRGGHWANYQDALWDGSSPDTGYDLTPTSEPRNTNWQSGDASYIEIRNISAAGPVMTMDIYIPPIFVDHANTGAEDGSQAHPFDTIDEALLAMPESPRTILVAGGDYPPMTLSTPCRLKGWVNGDAVLGR